MNEEDSDLRYRVKIYALPIRYAADLLTLLFWEGEDPPWEVFGLRLHPEPLPEGSRCMRIDYDWMSNCLRFAMQHESFDVVEEGTVPPIERCDVQVVKHLKDPKCGT